MLEYLAKRIATLIPTLIFVSMLIFGLQQLLPGDPALILAGEEGTGRRRAPAQDDAPRRALAAALRVLGGGVLRGDLGESVRMQLPVRELVAQKLRSRWGSR